MDPIKLAYIIGCKLAMQNATQFSEASQNLARGNPIEGKNKYVASMSEKEQRDSERGASWGNAMELTDGADPTFMS